MSGIIAAVFVPGIARTKGSLDFHGQGKVSEGVKFSKEWRATVRDAVYADRQRRGLTTPCRGPVAIQVTFWLERSSDGAEIARYDLDKLQRNIGDALADDQFNEGTRKLIPGTRAIFNDNQIIMWNDPAKLVSRPGGGDPGHGMFLLAWEPTQADIDRLRGDREKMLLWWRQQDWMPS